MSKPDKSHRHGSGGPAATGPHKPDGQPDRRRFVLASATVLGAGYAALLGYPVYRYLASPAEKAAQEAAVREVSLPDALKLPKGAALMFRFGALPSILIHHEDDTWTSFSAVCTHLGCTVQYEASAKRIFCACHGGVYHPRTGERTEGPPPKGLTVFRVEIKDGQINILRS